MKKRVLVADDDQDAADTLAILLRQQGYQVEVAYSGQQAMEIAAKFDPDVLILDLTMPALDGFQTANRLRALPGFANKHFIACTGHADQEHLDKASRVQFDDYLVKPCKFNLIVKILDELGGE